MTKPLRVLGLTFLLSAALGLGALAAAQDTLSAQVLRLLDRVNTWSVAQTFSADIKITPLHTGDPASTACDEAGEVGTYYFDSTNGHLFICGTTQWWRFNGVSP